jgi:coatomer protein complex subunit gamma
MEDEGLAGAVLKELQQVAEKFKDEDEEDGFISPYAHLEKSAVLQEARIFHDSIAVRENPRKCCTVIAQLLHLQNTGQFLSSVEATEVFFGVTKLFMSDDASLRRMVYLFIKEVAETCNPDDVIIVTSSLTKDMTCDVDLYRANALRVLARIIDSAMLGAIERYVKQAIVDSSGQVSSAALVSSLHLFDRAPDNAVVIKRWIGEVQEALSSANQMVQFHGMQLMYRIKSSDRLGVSKLVQQFSTRNSLRSPLAVVCLIRYTCKLLHDEVKEGKLGEGYQSSVGTNASSICAIGYRFLEASLRHKSEMVIYEAARAICSLPQTEAQDINPAITVLQMFLSSPKPTTRFGAMKILANVANNHPRLVAKCNEDLESLLSDPNRSIATLSITTLLKTGSESSIDRLLKQISTFLTDIADEYKITVVKSLQRLCFTYPNKHRILIGFMSNFLREEGGFDFKRTIVNGIITLIKALPESAESSLLHLCEFIEDCEFTMLSTQILHLLGELGPQTSAPARYIRFIYNRVMLENSCVRAAAIAALAKFAASCPSLRASIMNLLQRGLLDEDDETRDRTVLLMNVLQDAMDSNPYVPPSEEELANTEGDIPKDEPVQGDSAAYVLLDGMPVSFEKLRRSLMVYRSSPGSMESAEALTFANLPIVEDSAEETTSAQDVDMDDMGLGSSDVPSIDVVKEKADPAAAVYAIPELASLGRAFRSSAPVPLTESETEYVVSCIKHIFDKHVVLQFIVQNTIDDQRLENVTVMLQNDGDLFDITGEIPASKIKYGETVNSFVILERNVDSPIENSTFTCTLHFHVIQVDPSTGEDESDAFEEEYPLEDLEISTADYIAKVTVPDFRKAWENIGNDYEVLEKYALSFKNLDDAVAAVINLLGMQPCDGTASVKPNTGGKSHMLHLSGVFIGGKSTLARAQLSMQGDSSVVLKIAVRSEDENVPRMIADCIR